MQDDCDGTRILIFTLHNEKFRHGKNPKSEEIIEMMWKQTAEMKAGELAAGPLFRYKVFADPAAIEHYFNQNHITPEFAVAIFDGVVSKNGCTVSMPRSIERCIKHIPLWSQSHAAWNQMVNPAITKERTSSIAHMFLKAYERLDHPQPGMLPMGKAPSGNTRETRHLKKKKRQERSLQRRLIRLREEHGLDLPIEPQKDGGHVLGRMGL
jgi:hypothetical protein